MGCGTSKHTVAPEGARARASAPYRAGASVAPMSILASADPMDNFFSAILIGGYPATRAQKRTMTLPPLLKALKERIKTNIRLEVDRTKATDKPVDYSAECAKSINYLTTLLARHDEYHFFDLAAQVIVQSKKVWHLSDRSLGFFSQLKIRKATLFTGLIDKLQVLCESKGPGLQTDHIDTVIELLYKQMELPPKLLTSLDAFLLANNPDINSIIHSLRIEHGSKITPAALSLGLSHHDVPHALEIRMRTMHIVCDKLHLMSTDSKRDCFLRAIVGFMIEFHDFVQRDKGAYKSVELATAAGIVSWLTSHPALAGNPDLKKLIEFMADQIVVLGTTMVYSPIQTTDLSQLSLMFEDAAREARFPVVHPTNQTFVNDTKATMLITGVADKNPAAMPAVAIKQLSDAATATLPIIKSYFTGELQLERFFRAGTFLSYTDRSAPPTALDHQKFLITAVPHLCMRAELSGKDKAADVSTYIHFINLARRKLAEGLTAAEFKSDFDSRFTTRGLFSAVNSLLFSPTAITAEAGFCRSQTGGLEFVSSTLGKFIAPGIDSSSIIAATVPETDALNIAALKVFFDDASLDEAAKASLIKELLLAVIFQAGRIYSDRPELTYTVPPPPRFGGAAGALPDRPAEDLRLMGPVSRLISSQRYGMFSDSLRGSAHSAGGASSHLDTGRDSMGVRASMSILRSP